MPNPNLELLELAAERLRQLLPEIVFVGGCATGLLIDDPAAAPVRGTYDVDVIAEIGSYAEYTVFSERLRALGFKEDSREGAPLCRWIHGALTLDVMPLDSQVLGFSNRWYPDALRTAGNVQLRSGLIIRAINAPYFLGTKLEAFHGRGKRDYLASHDLEDFIAVVDGRSSLIPEVESGFFGAEDLYCRCRPIASWGITLPRRFARISSARRRQSSPDRATPREAPRTWGYSLNSQYTLGLPRGTSYS